MFQFFRFDEISVRKLATLPLFNIVIVFVPKQVHRAYMG